MQYLILKHTPYEYIKDSFDIVSTTDNLDEANNRLQDIATKPIDEAGMTFIAENWNATGRIPRGFKTPIKGVVDQAEYITNIGGDKFNN